MTKTARQLWAVLVSPCQAFRNVAEQPPFGLSLILLVVLLIVQSCALPEVVLGGYPRWVWLIALVVLGVPLSLCLTVVTWLSGRLLRLTGRFEAIFAASILCCLPAVLAAPLYPWIVRSWTGYHAWHALNLACVTWTLALFWIGLRECFNSGPRRTTVLAFPALVVCLGVAVWDWVDGTPPLEAAYPWARIDTPVVQVYFPSFVNRPAVQALAPECGKLMAEVSKLLEVEPPDFRTGLYLFPDDATHRKAVPSDWPEGTAFAHARAVSMIYAPWRRLRPTLAHELGHVVSIYRIAPDLGVQPLLCEGLAEFVGHTLNPEDPELELKITTATPLRTLCRSEVFYDQQSMGESEHSYPHAGSFVRYLVTEHGMKRFKQLCRESTDGALWEDSVERLEEAMEKVYGQDLAAMEAAWRAAEPPE